MVKKAVTWNSSSNFHMRPAGTFSQEMGRFSSSIRLTYAGFRADGKSMMNLMAASIPASLSWSAAAPMRRKHWHMPSNCWKWN